MSFNKFAQAVRAKFDTMSKQKLFIIAADKDSLFATYLASFPEGTNPLYITRTEHDCNCCKQFIRNIGNTVIIKDDLSLDSVWNVPGLEYPYDVVAAAMHQQVIATQIKAPWFTKEAGYGNEKTLQILEDGTAKQWHHFAGKTPRACLTPTPEAHRGREESDAHVFSRGLDELTIDAIEMVRGLVADNLLYKGAEWKKALEQFHLAKVTYDQLTSAQQKNNFVWKNINLTGAQIRNTSMGTLLIDLSQGKELEAAVKSYEDKVSGTNYKRSTALVTPAMITKAMETIREQGVEHMLQRRHATITDVGVNNVLWASGPSKAVMKSGLEQSLLGSIKKPAGKQQSNSPAMPMAQFIQEVLPTASAVELLFKGEHASNVMNLTTAVNGRTEGDPQLFKWNNDFAWAYAGNVTDSPIKQAVAKAGGNVTAPLRISLAWSNVDDLDLHVTTPSGRKLYYGNRHSLIDGGKLDVDAMCGGGSRRSGQEVNPVENIFFNTIEDGTYKVHVNNFRRVERIDVGYTVEVEVAGQVLTFSQTNNNTMNGFIELAFKNGVLQGSKAPQNMSSTALSRDIAGVKTNEFIPVQFVMRSPNFWDGQAIGNEHIFFMLEGMKTDEPIRGIFNEFLHGNFHEHRKVFELIADKTKCDPTDDQLCGVGFSTTKPASVVVRVTTEQGKKEYTLAV